MEGIQSCTGRSNGNNNTEKEECYLSLRVAQKLKIGLNNGLDIQGGDA